MTLKEFLGKIKRKKGWKLYRDDDDGALFIRRDGQCPISALKERPTEDWEMVSYDIGLDRRLADRIVAASDGETKGPIRKKLLAACGIPLEE